MADREYRILVSYALATSAGAVFQDVEKSSARARTRIEGDAAAASAAQVKAAQKAADAQNKAADAAAAKAAKAYEQIVAASEKAAAQEVAAANRASQGKVAAEQRAFDQRLRLAQRESAARERLREQENRKIVADVEKAARQEQAARDRANKTATQERTRSLTGFASGAYQNMTGAASRALGLTSRIAGGMGVNLDIGSQIAASGDFKRQIVDVTNAGLGIQGKLAGKSDYSATTSAVEGAADYTKIDQNKIAAGLSVFVDKASDIEAGKAMLKGLGDIAQASGTDFVELAGSAGEFFKMMGGEGPEKIKNVEKLLALAAKQGQVGNLAFKELAPTIGKLAAQGQKISGDYTENLGQLMALSQVSLQGGATKGAEANRAAQAFVMDLSKGSSLKTFAKHGVKVFEDQNAQGGGTVLRNTRDIIVDVFRKSGGDIKALTDEFKGQKSGNVITGFANIFRAAGGTGGKPGDIEKGIAAIDANFKKFKEPMSEAEIKNSAGAVRDTAGAKAEAFNNQLERIAGSLAERVLPQMEKLGPKILELVESLSAIIGWAAENPGKAIVGALVASILQAGASAAVSGAIAALIKSLAGGGAGGLGGGVGGAGALGAAALAGVAIGSGSVLYAQGKLEAGADKATDVAGKSSDIIDKAMAEYRTKGELSPEMRKALHEAEMGNKQELAQSVGGTSYAAIFNPFDHEATLAKRGEEEGARMNAGTLDTQNNVIEQLLAAPAKKHADAADKLSKAADSLTKAADAMAKVPGPGRAGIPGHGGT